MPTSASGELRKPRHWEEFESLSRDIYEIRWDDPHTRLHGRSGQKQQGVDIYGRPRRLGGKYAGVQCKRWEDGRLTQADIEKEIAAAEGFRPALAEYTIATTLNRDANLERIVREISDERLQGGKFPVYIVFWEDLTELLGFPAYHDVLYKHYAEYAPPPRDTQLPEFIRLLTENREIGLQLTSVQERLVQGRLETLRRRVNQGYSEAARPEVVELVEEVAGIPEDSGFSRGLRGRIYRLAAAAYLPSYPGGDANRCREYLLKAQSHSLPEDQVRCRLIEGMLRFLSSGPAAAIASVDGFLDDDVQRFRFSVYVESGELATCAQMLQAMEDGQSAPRSEDWLSPLAHYYAATGDKVRLEGILNRLVRDGAAADDLAAAGYALVHMAFIEVRRFCAANGVCPLFHIPGLDLDYLVDREARQRAAELLARAAALYESEGCPSTALEHLEAAVRLVSDPPVSELRDQLLGRLAQAAPEHPLVLLAEGGTPTQAVGSLIDRLSTLLQDPSAEPDLILGIAVAGDPPADAAEQILELLRQHEARFVVSDDVRAKYLQTLFCLQEQVGDNARMLAWLSSVVPPAAYAHLRPLWHILHFARRNDPRSREWLELALQEHPRHPEILVVAIRIFGQLGEPERELECARELFGLLRTPSTAEALLVRLSNAERDREFLDIADQVADLPVNEALLHQGRAHAFLRADDLVRAHQHLQWLYDRERAGIGDMLILAGVLQGLGEVEAAIGVLRESVKRYPDAPDGYRRLSELYLAEGRGAEAYRQAVVARQRFPDDEDLAVQLIDVAFATGHELRPEAVATFREFMRGGRFEGSDRIQERPVTDLERIREASSGRAEVVANLYEMNQISSLLQSYTLNLPLFEVHYRASRGEQAIYAAVGNWPYAGSWLHELAPRAVVLDYSALLTLWLLYGEGWVGVLRDNFERIWISAELPRLMAWEQGRLARHGQPSQYDAHREIERAIRRPGSRFHLSTPETVENGVTLSAAEIEVRLATELGTIYVNEYRADDGAGVSIVGMQLLASVLRAAGEADPEMYRALTANTHAPTPEEEALRPRLSRGSAVMVSIATLTRIAQAGGLETLQSYFSRIHLCEPVWAYVRAQLDKYELGQEMLTSFRRLRDSLGQAIDSGFIRTRSAPPQLRLLGRMLEDDPDGEPDSQLPDTWGPALAYLDDLLSTSHLEQCPIWTDDRFTSKPDDGQRTVPYTFGTDSFLASQRAKGVPADDCYARYGKLIRWNYLGLPPSPDYIEWLLEQGVSPDEGSLASALSSYRGYVIRFWAASREGARFSTMAALEVYTAYNDAVVETMLRCFRCGMDMDTSAALYAQLDLSRHASWLEGQEPQYLSALLYRIAKGQRSDGDRNHPSRGQETFGEWFDTVLRTAGVSASTICEAWMQMLDVLLGMEGGRAQDEDLADTALFAGGLLSAAPPHVRDYLFTSYIGAELERVLGIRGTATLTLELYSPSGPFTVNVPARQWDADLRAAVVRYLSEELAQPYVSGGLTVLKADLPPGSVHLRLEVLPSAVHEQEPDVEGVPVWFSILPAAAATSAAERLGFWRKGLRDLESLGLPTADWLDLRNAIGSDSSDEGVAAGLKARRHLLGQMEVIRGYLAEGALERLLPYLQPEVVRSWLGMPAINWDDQAALEDWARWRMSASPSDQLAYSIFPDAPIWREGFATAAEGRDEVAVSGLMEELLCKAEEGASPQLKANVILTILRLDECSGGGILSQPQLEERVRQLLLQIAKMGGEPDSAEHAHAELGRALCDHLYTVWRASGMNGTPPTRELAYLAALGASVIADLVFRSRAMSMEMAYELSDRLDSATHQFWLANTGPTEQPAGIFKPRWGRWLNYPLGFVLSDDRARGGRLAALLKDEATCRVLLHACAHERISETCLHGPEPQRDWLDCPLLPDTGLYGCQLLTNAEDPDVMTPTEEARLELTICAAPDAGPQIFALRLERLSSADEPEVVDTMKRAFQAAPAWNEEAHKMVDALLRPEALIGIARFPSAWSELILSLLELLCTDERLPAALQARVGEVVFGMMLRSESRGASLMGHATVLSSVVGSGRWTEGVQSWLRELASDEDLKISEFRQGIIPFLETWMRYPAHVREPIGATLLEVADNARVAHLWELERVRRQHASLHESSRG